MATVYRDERSFYEEDGRFYLDSSKRIEVDTITYAVINKTETEQVETETVITEEPKIETQTVIERPVVTETVFVCDVCGKPAKSNAGLSAHKRKAHK